MVFYVSMNDGESMEWRTQQEVCDYLLQRKSRRITQRLLRLLLRNQLSALTDMDWTVLLDATNCRLASGRNVSRRKQMQAFALWRICVEVHESDNTDGVVIKHKGMKLEVYN